MMTKEEYFELYKDVRWQQKRLEIFNRDDWSCCRCHKASSDKTKLTLHVHHLYYVRRNKPWEYPNSALITLCAECHEDESDCVHDYASDALLEMKRTGFMSLHFGMLVQLLVRYREDHQEADMKFGEENRQFTKGNQIVFGIRFLEHIEGLLFDEQFRQAAYYYNSSGINQEYDTLKRTLLRNFVKDLRELKEKDYSEFVRTLPHEGKEEEQDDVTA